MLETYTAKIRAVATSVVTLFTGLAVLVTAFSNDIADVVPAPYGDDIQAVAVKVVAWLAFAVAALRKVTPVPKDEVGIT